MPPLVSIIIPNYNHAPYLRQRLDSVFNQTFQDIEIILLDDASTDDSWEILQEYANNPKVSHCIQNEVNSGSPFKQWKKGIELAKGEWVWIAESDDWAELEFLQKLIVHTSDPRVNMIFSKSMNINEKGELISPAFTPSFIGITEKSFISMLNAGFLNGNEAISKYFLYVNLIPNASSCIFIRPQSFSSKVLNMSKAGDWVFWIHNAKNGGLVYCDHALNYFRFHSNVTRTGESKNFIIDYMSEINVAIQTARKVGAVSIMDISLKHYKYLTVDIFNSNRKKGRFTWNTLFPSLPLIFTFSYYYAFFKSFIPKEK